LKLRHAVDEPFAWSDRAQAQRLRVVRGVYGATEREAADAFGVRLRTYRKYEAGRLPRSSVGFVRFARVFGISLDWLICGDGHWRSRLHARQLPAGGRVAIFSAVKR
jgi:transcriptional regulator with XRE-family HTH domain